MNDINNGNISLAAIILAAGDGRRFGKPKWQGQYQGKTFLEIIKEKLFTAGISDIICIKQKSFDIKLQDLFYVDNPTPEYGMISSLYYALQAYPDYQSYLIIPVDHPLVEVSTIKKLADSFTTEDEKIIRPTYNGIPGHPIIIPSKILSCLTTPNYPGGLRQLIKDSLIQVADISVEDCMILKNVNLETDLISGGVCRN